jgi:Zn-dependent protease
MSDERMWAPIEAPALAGHAVGGPAAASSVIDDHHIGGMSPAPGPAGGPFGEQRQRGRLRNRIASVLAGAAALIAKFAGTFKALLLALPKLKLLTVAGTAFISVIAYSLFFGWPFAVGLIALLFVHEMGHVIQLRREGLQASGPYFHPLGATIFARSFGDNAAAEARVGLAGPILGTLGAAALAGAGALLNSDLLLALAYFGFFLNLINLIPVVPFDGGRAMAAVAPSMWFLGIGALVALTVYLGNPFLLIFILLAMYEMPRRWRQLKSRSLESAAYYRVPRGTRIAIGTLYVALAVTLAFGMDATHILASGGHSLTSF